MSKLLPILDNFILKVQPEWKAIHDVADKYLPVLKKCYINAFNALSNSINVDNFSEDAIDWSIFRKVCEKNYDITGRVIMDGGTQASFYLSHQKFWTRNQNIRKDSTTDGSQPLTLEIPVIITPISAIGAFNFRNPKAIQWASDYVGNNIREVEQETRTAIRTLIENALKYGGHPYETAKEIKQFIGLTDKQMQSILNYKRELSTSGLSVLKIDELVEIQKQKMIKVRAETIARTETIDAANQGQLLHWDDMASKGYLDKKYIKKKWSITPDDRLCLVCGSIGGEIVNMDEPFSWGGMRPTRHPKCRCSLSLIEVDENGDEIE